MRIYTSFKALLDGFKNINSKELDKLYNLYVKLGKHIFKECLKVSKEHKDVLLKELQKIARKRSKIVTVCTDFENVTRRILKMDNSAVTFSGAIRKTVAVLKQVHNTFNKSVSLPIRLFEPSYIKKLIEIRNAYCHGYENKTSIEIEQDYNCLKDIVLLKKTLLVVHTWEATDINKKNIEYIDNIEQIKAEFKVKYTYLDDVFKQNNKWVDFIVDSNDIENTILEDVSKQGVFSLKQNYAIALLKKYFITNKVIIEDDFIKNIAVLMLNKKINQQTITNFLNYLVNIPLLVLKLDGNLLFNRIQFIDWCSRNSTSVFQVINNIINNIKNKNTSKEEQETAIFTSIVILYVLYTNKNNKASNVSIENRTIESIEKSFKELNIENINVETLLAMFEDVKNTKESNEQNVVSNTVLNQTDPIKQEMTTNLNEINNFSSVIKALIQTSSSAFTKIYANYKSFAKDTFETLTKQGFIPSTQEDACLGLFIQLIKRFYLDDNVIAYSLASYIINITKDARTPFKKRADLFKRLLERPAQFFNLSLIKLWNDYDLKYVVLTKLDYNKLYANYYSNENKELQTAWFLYCIKNFHKDNAKKKNTFKKAFVKWQETKQGTLLELFNEFENQTQTNIQEQANYKSNESKTLK